MKTFINSIITTAALAIFFMGPALAFASDLSVTFEHDPLFENANVIPGDSESRTVTVTNNGEEDKNVRVSIKNPFNNGLADVMELTITSSVGTHYDGYFDDFFDAVPVELGSLSTGESRIYTFTASLDSRAGNDYELTSMGFDLCVGFSGTEIVCDDNSEDENENLGGGGNSSGLRVFNEEVESETGAQPVVLSWNTNEDATTYLVCGNETQHGGSFTLDENEPFFGYQFDVNEDTELTAIHSVELSGLLAGEYVCIPAAREDTNDGFTTGDEMRFEITPGGQVLGETFIGGVGGAFIPHEKLGEVRGINASNQIAAAGTSNSDLPQNDVLGENTSRTSSPAAIMWDDAFCTLWWLLLLVLISFAWSYYDDKYRNDSPEFADLFKRNAIFTIVYVIAALVFHFAGLLDIFWWILAASWAIMTGFDYREHRSIQEVKELIHRVLYFGAAGLLFIFTSLLFGFPCVWWPFFLIFVGSGIVYFFDLYDRS